MKPKAIILFTLIILSAISCRNSKEWENVEYDTSMKCDSLHSEEVDPSGERYPIKCKTYFNNDTLVVFLSPSGRRYITIKIHDGKFKAEAADGVPYRPEEISLSTISQKLQLGKKQYSVNDTICGSFDVVYRDIETTKTFDWNFKGSFCEIIRDEDFDPLARKNFMNFDVYTAIHEIGEPLRQDTFNTEEDLSAFRLYGLQDYFSPPSSVYIKELTWDTSPERYVSDSGKSRLTIWYVEKQDKWIPVRHRNWVEDVRTAEELYRYPEYKTFNRDLKVYHVKEPAFSKEAEDIEAMPLRRDTLKFYSYPDYLKKLYHHNKYLYFDDKGRLRKYWTYNSASDGSHEFIELRAYYNTKGELIYMDYSDGSSCSAESGYFELRNDKIVAHDNSSVCWCCEEDNDSIFTRKLAEIGKPLPRKKSSWWDSSSFSDAATLLNVLRIYEYEGGLNGEFLGKENTFSAILDKMEEKKELVNETIILNERGWYRDEVIVSRDTGKRIRKCDLSSSLENGSEFISAYYDISGNLFLISCSCYGISDNDNEKNRDEESLTLYIEDGTIIGCNYYSNSEINTNGESYYIDERERIMQSFIGTKLDKTPYLKRDLSRFLNTEKLKILIQ